MDQIIQKNYKELQNLGKGSMDNIRELFFKRICSKKMWQEIIKRDQELNQKMQ